MTTITRQSESLEDALTDVETRFIYSFPESELNKTDRLFFQIEQAYWYYEDFKADRFNNLPHFHHLKNFAKKIFEHCELLKNKSNQFQELFENYANYKSKIPVCGCILLNPGMNKVVLVCNWDGKSWSFPRGKIDENEIEFNCAMREVAEETGFNPEQHCNENEFLVCFQDQKKIQLFIGINVPEDTVFQSRTRKEISKIEFFDLNNLPKSTFLVHPFIPKLKRWIEQKQKTIAKHNSTRSPYLSAVTGQSVNLVGTKKILTPSRNKDKNKDNNNNNSNSQPSPKPSNLSQKARRNPSYSIDARNVDTFALFPSILGESPGGEASSSGKFNNQPQSSSQGWSVDDMFKANAKITGKEYDYDGNPHSFGSSHPKFVNYRDYNDLKKHLAIARNTNNTAPKSIHNNNNMNFDSDFHTLSLQSHTLGEKFLRATRRGIAEMEGDDINDLIEDKLGKEFDAFSLPTSSYYQNIQGNNKNLDNGAADGKKNEYRISFFPVPFRLDTKEIMDAIDAKLADFSFE
jgi:mRNA-decapping enzyme subunit 2